MPFDFVRRHPVWTWVALALPLIAILILVYIPKAIEWGLERWLEKQGRIAVEIDDVDFNPFSGRLVVHTLLAEREEGPGRLSSERLALNIEWWPLARKRLLFEQLTVRDAFVTVRRAGETWFVGGLRIDTGEEAGKAESAWRVGFEGVNLRNVKIVYLEGDRREEVTIEEAHLDAMAGWNPEQTGEFSLRLRAAGTPFTLSGRARPFAGQPVVEGRLETSGFPLPALQPWLVDRDIEIEQGQLSAAFDLNGKLLPEAGRLHLTLDGTLALAGVQAALPGYTVERGAFTWQGELELAAPRQGKPPLLTAKGTLTSPGLTVFLAEEALRATVGELSIEEAFAMGTPEVPAGADFLLRLQGAAGALQVVNTERKLTLAAAQKLSFSGVRLVGMGFAAQALTATDLRLLQRPSVTGQKPSHFLTVQRLTVSNVDGTPAAVNLGAVRLQGVRGTLLRQANGDIDLEPWSIAAAAEGETGGAAGAPAEAAPFPATRIGLLEIAGDNRLRYVDASAEPDVTVTVTPLQARMENLNTAAAADAAPSPVRLRLQANGHPLSFEGTARFAGDEMAVAAQAKMTGWPLALFAAYLPEVAFRQGTADFDGKVDLVYAPANDRFRAELAGSFALTSVRGTAPATVLRGGSAAFRGTLTAAGGAGGSDLRLQGRLRLVDIDGSFGGTGLADSTATLDGRIQIATAPATDAEAAVVVDGKLQIPRLHLRFPASPLVLEGREGKLQGTFAVGTPAVPAGAEFLVTVSGSTGALRLADAKRDLDLFAAAAVTAENLRVTGPQTISAATLAVLASRLLERSGNTKAELPHMLAAASLNVSGLRLAQPHRLQLKELRLRGVEGMLVRNAAGEFDFGAWPETAPEPPAGATAPQRAEQPWQVRAGLVAIEGESRLLFRDFSVDPAVRLELQPFAARLENLDTGAAAPAPFGIEANFGRYAPLRVEGKLTAVGPPPTLAGTAAVEGFNLPEITGYIEHSTGYMVRSGQLDLDLEGKIVQGKVQAAATAVLTQLDLEPLATEERAETERQLGFPLNTGLSLLRDQQGTIALDFPITGDIRSPEVGLAGIVQTAVFKAMRGATLSYLADLGATALGAPVGASFLAKRIFERFTAVRFRPVSFAAGVADLGAGSRQYVEEIAVKLRDRGEISIVLCGVATPADAVALPPPATEEELRQLAQERSEAVKQALVDLGIAAGRLVICAPEFLPQEDGGPRVEVGI